MNALDRVLADPIEADRDCAYVTIKREPLEELIDDWAGRGDRLAQSCVLLTRARIELAQALCRRRDEQVPPSARSRSLESTIGALNMTLTDPLGQCPSPPCCQM